MRAFSVALASALLGAALGTPAAPAAAQALPPGAQVLEAMTRANRHFMEEWPDPGLPVTTDKTRESNLWTRAVYYEGLMALYRIDPRPEYLRYALAWADAHHWNLRDGRTYTRNADDQAAGQTYIELYQQGPRPERIQSIKASIDSMMATDKVDDWHWIDAIQMAMPVFAKLGVVTGNHAYWERMYQMYAFTRDRHGDHGLFNPRDGLWWRDADFDPPHTTPAGKMDYWSRGNGWVLMAFARVLDVLPAAAPHRNEYLRDFRQMAAALVPLQRPDGFWNVSLMDSTNFGGPETSGTAMFTYGMAWGINHGVLDAKTYGPVVARAWTALSTKALHPDGFLGYVQGTGKQPSEGQPVTYDHRPDFDDYALGALLLAGGEVYRLTPTAQGKAAPPAAGRATSAAARREAGGATSHTVTFDRYSLLIDGKRVYILSGEFHYWRLPSPDLWLDVLQKMKAHGYNAVSIYFDWAYHTPKPGVYDFTGVRDVDRLLKTAQEVGLYVISRQGPYINAEADAGGYPGWLVTQAGRARSDAPDYLAAVDEWFTHINAILRRHQLTDGSGPIILYQIENELSAVGESQQRYMQHLYDRARADGITVPIFHNDKGRNGYWVPRSSTVAGTVPGAVDLYAFDGYPGGQCHGDGTPGAPNAAPDWGLWGPGGAKGGATASPETPGFIAEFGGGWFDHWGSAGTYPCTAIRQGPGYERVFYQTNVANGITLQNIYMAFGGTSWGWIPAPVVYTSYDYGAGLDEARQIRPKLTTLKEIGLFLQSAAPITELTRGDAVTSSSPAIRIYHDVNPDVGTHVYFVVHNPSSATTDDTASFQVATRDGSYRVPVRVNGQDAKMLLADYTMGGQHLVHSTSEILTHLALGGSDLTVLHGRDHEAGETVLRYASRPRVTVLAGRVASSFDPKSGDLRLSYTHEGLLQLRIAGGGRRPLLLLLADETTAGSFWRPGNDVLVRGPYLVRTATVAGPALRLTGDTKAASPLEVWVPPQVTKVSWNGADVAVRRGASGALVAVQPLPGAEDIRLPDLTRAVWRMAEESPEAAPAFDDAPWQAASRTSTSSRTKPDSGQVVLTMDDYGFHYGDVWYRGRFAGAASASGVKLRFGGGGAGLLQAWLDGTYLGQHVLPSGGAQNPPTTGTAALTIPAALRVPGPHVLAVMVRSDGHNEDGGTNDAHKEGRGLISVALTDSTGSALPAAIAWKIQGAQGGEELADVARGPMNNGGLFGERHGWHLPGFPDESWRTATLPAAGARPGTTWYRTTFTLNIPATHDASLGITIGNPAARSSADYRALLFVNGWNMGQYIADVGPQHTFVLPAGVLDPRGANTLAIAVTSDGGSGNGLETVQLVNLGTVRGGVSVRPNPAPRWDRRWAAAQR